MSVVVGFVDEYAPDVAGVHAASAALASGGRVEVNWPARTQSLLVRKVPGWDHSAIDADEVAQSWGGSYAEAVRFARSAARLSRLSEFLEYLGASDERHAHALSVYLRLGNLAIIRSLYSTLLQSEGDLVEEEHSPRLFTPWTRYNSNIGLAALGVREPIHSVNVYCSGIEPSLDVFAPASLVKSLRYRDPLPSDLLAVWALPQFILPKGRQYDMWERLTTEDCRKCKMQSRRNEAGDEY